MFDANLKNSRYAKNKKNNIIGLAKDFVQGINGTTIYAEGLHKINFTENIWIIYKTLI